MKIHHLAILLVICAVAVFAVGASQATKPATAPNVSVDASAFTPSAAGGGLAACCPPANAPGSAPGSVSGSAIDAAPSGPMALSAQERDKLSALMREYALTTQALRAELLAVEKELAAARAAGDDAAAQALVLQGQAVSAALAAARSSLGETLRSEYAFAMAPASSGVGGGGSCCAVPGAGLAPISSPSAGLASCCE
jgi:hypothetical protein